jgi:hypothetical protein
MEEWQICRQYSKANDRHRSAATIHVSIYPTPDAKKSTPACVLFGGTP